MCVYVCVCVSGISFYPDPFGSKVSVVSDVCTHTHTHTHTHTQKHAPVVRPTFVARTHTHTHTHAH